MAIPIYSGTVPNLNQTQQNFDVNTQDFIDYIADLAPELNTFAGQLNNFSTTTTSNTSNTIGTGNKTFTVEAGKSFIVGMSLRAANSSTNYMKGEVVSYSGTSLVINIKSFKGSGTFASWNIFDSQDSIISTSQIQDDAITTSKILNDNVTLAKLENAAKTNKIQPIAASVGSGRLTITLNPTTLDFRSAVLGSGNVNTRNVPSAISLVISSASSLGTVSAQKSRIAVLAIDNAGTVELAAVNVAGGINLDETGVISTTAEGASNSDKVIYSATARTNVPYRVVGYVESTQATAGTWATPPSHIQGYGGQAFAAFSSLGYGQTWQNVTGSRSKGTTYYNTTGKPILVIIKSTQTTGNTALAFSIDGVELSGAQGAAATSAVLNMTVIVPAGRAYSVTVAVGSIATWFELR